jgi:N-acetylneuraminic acid mutarotase
MKKYLTSTEYHPQQLALNFFIFLILLSSLPSVAQNFSTITWSTAASQKYPVSEGQGKVVNGKLYSFGGFDSQKSTFTPTKRSYVYNPSNNTWAAIADLPFTPNGTTYGGVTHAGIATDGIDIYLASGYTSNTAGTGQIFGTRQVWKYNVVQNSYTKLPDLPITTASGQLEYLNGKLHYIGGTNAARTLDLGTHYALNLNNLIGGWATLAALPNPRHHAGSAVFGGKIYYIGGQHGHDDNLVTQKDVHAYDPATNTWTKMADMPVPAGVNGRGHISSGVTVMGNRILVLGGEIVHKTSTNMVSAYTPETNSWQNLTPLPQNRFSGVAGSINGLIYYSGGSRTSTTFKGTPALENTTTTFLPSADAFVRNGNYAGTNYGTDTSLIIKAANVSGYSRMSYLRFSLGTATNITSAKLRVYGRNIDNTNTVKIFAYGVNNDTWTETGITFSNAPTASTSVLDSAAVNNVAKYYDIDITSFVKTQASGDKIVSVLLKDPLTKNTNIVFNSKEHKSNKPQLVISTSTGTSSSITNTQINMAPMMEEVTIPKLYPNPSKGKFVIQFPEHYEGITNIDLLDQSGKIYHISEIGVLHGGMEADIDVTKFSLKAGVYFLKIRSADRTNNIPVILK